ncbi:MAG TPA: 2,3-diphosphoglycerate-dependent phosphoglycerate mutase [Candidatus Thalassarchaeaceae archaeon]|jgi:2,3-bisphosphoglycerate-dependent phosphoglycerate mutase|nr:2,3-diphosphoglycerate-dependent phosphoglycerate mutase [Candidatus Thalassarchaeaceae archaeon]HJL59182.1 2,3-diphosphoglycerate-dependent phosphoglycerate mutase [Candidatus Thalassarchaeaceae archaeon]HJM19051.1 2,3-diphosphoglycerate-dependent phosphoglycerate mutase [Candidatus Thalassarchaeaceae archaeon]
MAQMILLRHGQSVWNAANKFTGWTDVGLSPKGEEEATQAGHDLAQIAFDIIYTSDLKRAQRTAEIAMSFNSSSNSPPTITDWRLNERHYGDLQGLNKDETREKYGDEQVHIWRRSYDTPPPGGESLETCAERTIPCLEELIIPDLKDGKTVLVAAHGNSLRSIVMHIEGLSKEEVLSLEIPTGIPIIYEFANDLFIRN